MIKILLSGCNGRMGRAVTALCQDSADLRVAAGLDINAAKLDTFPVYADPLEFSGHVDVVVDFSHTSTLESLLTYCMRRTLPLVLCTTGYTPEQQARIAEASKEIPLFRSGNMSLGMNLLIDLVNRAAKVLGDSFDIEIVEKHHNQKLDAPSGTAMMLLDAVSDALPYTPAPVYDRHEVNHKRTREEIGMHAIRGGTIVGEHDVVFAGHHEVITLSHSAGSREVFAAGAVHAAQFMAGVRTPGLYNMSHLLKDI